VFSSIDFDWGLNAQFHAQTAAFNAALDRPNGRQIIRPRIIWGRVMRIRSRQAHVLFQMVRAPVSARKGSAKRDSAERLAFERLTLASPPGPVNEAE
jgi:hypothetical protein